MSAQPALQFDPLAAAAFVERRRQDAEALGLTVRVRRDFAALQRPGEAGGQPAGRLFGAAGFDLLAGRAFWIETADLEGRRVHQQAMRHEDLAGATAAELLESQLRRLFPETAERLPGPLDCAPILHRLRGRLVWHGEAWLAESWRGRNLAGPLGELALCLALIEWRPDAILGVASEHDTRRGYPLREGYHHAQPLGELWRLAPSWLYSDDWINWVEADELVRLVGLDRGRSESPHPRPARG
ncbi:MAG: hypothetical protein WD341_09290 [Tistlia sp.]|uniref:hypothetical protein n=1 Tax=Tistlia sp. TaxID=3057121 RepID=UPI0034A2C9C0